MLSVKGVITQGGADTFTSVQVLTGLTADGKAGWDIKGFRVFWSNGYTAVAGDAILNGVLATIPTVTLPNNDAEILRVSWGVQNTAGVAVAFNFEPIKSIEQIDGRVTAQPDLYVHANSTGTGLTNVLYYQIDYEIVKLSDLEVLRLLVGGA